MAYQAIYRKWRPVVFEDIVGQNHITTTLRNQVTSGRVSHAYLFCGTRGTGKTTCAKVFSRAVNCLNPQNGSPCNECEICKGILDGSIMDVSEIDAASNNGVENIREIREDVNYVATRTKYRVYIIDEVHMLSDGAFNALLKTLEEPPAHVIFILATTEAHKMPETILSRCQRFDFKRIRNADISARMKEIAYGDGLKITESAFSLLAKLADGSMRDGLSILERCVLACGDSIDAPDITSVLGIADSECNAKAVECMEKSDTQGILKLLDSLVSDGRDLNLFVDSLVKYLRDLMVAKVCESPRELLDYAVEELPLLTGQAERLSFEKLSHAASVLNSARAEAKWVKSPRMIYELALIKLTAPALDNSEESLLDRIKTLEKQVKDGIKVVATVDESAKKEEPQPKKEPKQPSAKLFVPIDESQLTASSPVVIAARKWETVAASIAKKYPHIAHCVIDRKITIDGEGIILIFEATERMLKGIAAAYVNSIREMVEKGTGYDFVVKAAFREDIEDNIIDYWSIKGASPEMSENIPDSDVVSGDNIQKQDPLDELIEKYPEIVEVTDESEFLEYDVNSEDFEQSELDEEETEEFITEDERKLSHGE